MSWETALVVFVVGAHIVLAGLVLFSLLRGAGAEPETDTSGRKVLRPSRVLLWTGILLAIWAFLGLYMAGEALMRERVQSSGVLVGGMVTLAAGLMGAWVLARYFNFQIVWDEECLEVTGLRGNRQKYRWRDLTDLSRRKGENNVYGLGDAGQTEVRIYDIELHFTNGGLVRAAPNLVGYHGFVADAIRHWDNTHNAAP